MVKHVSETPATQLLKANKVAFTEHPYDYLEHGGAQHSAQVLGFDPFMVVKTLVMQDQDAKPLLVLMHGNRKVSTKTWRGKSGPSRSSRAHPRWPTGTVAIWWAVRLRLAHDGRCRCISRKAFWACPKY